MGGSGQELSGPDLAAGVPLASLEPNAAIVGHVNGENVLLVRIGDEVHAVGATCTHYGGPLVDGIVVGETVRCPWHHACFDLRTGEAHAPALADLPCYQVERAGDLVQVRTKRAPAKPRVPPAAPSSIAVVGAGAAAAAFVTTLRKEGYGGPITMIGSEEPGPVDRPNLSKDYLAGNAPDEWIPLPLPDGVDLLRNDPAVAIDVRAKSVTTKSGRVVDYDALLYATGAEPSRLPIPGSDAPNVLTLRTLADSRAIIARVTSETKPAKRAVVVGASFIGLEVAASLVARGLEVHVVAPDKVPLARVLGEELGRFIAKVHEDRGTHLHLGVKPTSIGPKQVELDDGSSIEHDLVVLGVGVKPRVALAERAGLLVDNGVVVDELLRTSEPSVWAAGDVARHPDARLGTHVRIEHWFVAERQGQAAARAMLGMAEPYRDVPFFWSAHHDVVVAYVGHAPDWDAIEVFGSIEARDAAVAYRKGGKVLAVATINRDRTSLQVEAAMDRGDVDAIDALLRG